MAGSAVSHPSQERTRWAVLRAFGVAFTAAMSPWLVGMAHVGVDATRDNLGWLCQLRAELASGHWPWVAPLLGMGGPMWGTPAAQVAYPVRWVQVLLGDDLGAQFGVAFHLGVAAAGAAWLARSFGVRRAPALWMGLAWCLTGVMVDLPVHAQYLSSGAWVPLGWAAARDALRPWGVRGAAHVAAASLAAALLAMEPQSGCVLGALVMLTALPFLRGRRRGPARQLLALCTAGGLIGLAPWAVTLSEMVLSKRGSALPVETALVAAFSPMGWLAALVPGILATPMQGGANLWVLMQSGPWLMPWNRHPYVGATFLVLFLAAWSVRRARLPWLVAVMFLLMALGSATPVMPALLRWVPPLALFRFPAKYLLGAQLAGLVAVTLALQSASPLRRLVAPSLGVAAAFFAAALAWAATAPLSLLLAGLSSPPGGASPTSVLVGGLAHALCATGLALVACTRKPAGRWLAVVILGDLGLAAVGQVHLGPAPAERHSPLARLADGDAVLCHAAAVSGLTYADAADHSLSEQDAFERDLAVPNTHACDGVRSGVSYSPVQTRTNAALSDQLDGAHPVAAARALGCTHLVTPRRPPDEPVVVEQWSGSPDVLHGRGGPVRAVRVPDPVPLVFVVGPAGVLHATEELAVAAVVNTHSAADAVAQLDDPLGRGPRALPTPGQVDSAELSWPAPHHASIRVAGRGGAVVGLRTAYLVGWVATQAGAELPLLRSAGSMVAVVVEDVSRGPVELRYVPPRWWLSLLLASLGAGLWVAWVLWSRFSGTARIR